jgi:hypothetical protein
VALVPGTYVVDAEKVVHSIDFGIRAGPEPNARRFGRFAQNRQTFEAT